MNPASATNSRAVAVSAPSDSWSMAMNRIRRAERDAAELRRKVSEQKITLVGFNRRNERLATENTALRRRIAELESGK